jgi:hypothetical protein
MSIGSLDTATIAHLMPQIDCFGGIFTHTPRRHPSAAERRLRPFPQSSSEGADPKGTQGQPVLR